MKGFTISQWVGCIKNVIRTHCINIFLNASFYKLACLKALWSFFYYYIPFCGIHCLFCSFYLFLTQNIYFKKSWRGAAPKSGRNEKHFCLNGPTLLNLWRKIKLRKLIYKNLISFLFIEGQESTGSLKNQGAFPAAFTMIEKRTMSRGSMNTLL